MMLSRRVWQIFVLVALVSCASPAFSEQERITSFDSLITVNEDSSLSVTETIQVISQGNQIRRGIYRDFPTHYKDRFGNYVIVGFTVLSILRDNHPEPYHIESVSNGQRIYIGKSDYFIPNGPHTYEITYRTTRQLGFFADHDELYWNVTGNGWDFSIAKVIATVALPKDAAARIMETNAFTGYKGAREKDFVINRDRDGTPQFRTTRTLNNLQGLTIVVSWPKGYVHPPSSADKLGYFLRDNRGLIIVGSCFAFVVFYYLFVWYHVGRDPKKGTIIPLFHPPKDLSASAVRYLWKMGYDQQAFSVAVVNLAVKGYLKIEETVPWDTVNLLNIGRTYTLKACAENKEKAAPEEEKVFSTLLGSKHDTLLLKNENYSKIGKAIEKLKSALAAKEEKVYFFSNRGYFGFGAVVSFITLYLMLQFTTNEELNGLTGLILFLLLVIINLIFYRILKAPTLLGRKLMDELEGFRQFLSVTEKDRLNMLNPPDKTPELFEKYLPYALALDVEQKWGEQFTGILAKAADGKEYTPSWYSGSNWSSHYPTRFTSSLSSSLTSTISSASTAPGSSSGGGGGGSSGGGGGGGGGGGW